MVNLRKKGRLTFAQFLVNEGIKHVTFAPCHRVHEEIGGVARKQMDDFDDFLLRLTMGTSSDLPFILSAPRLILFAEVDQYFGRK